MKNYKAGKELNILIVEKVLGRVPCRHWERFRAGQMILTDRCPHDLGECYPQRLPAQYSENAEAASRVIELICSDHENADCHIEARANYPTGVLYAVVFGMRLSDIYWDQVREFDSLPLAICVAALNFMERHSNEES